MNARFLAAGLVGAVAVLGLLFARCAMEPDVAPSPPPVKPQPAAKKKPRTADAPAEAARPAAAAIPADPDARTILVTDLADAPIAEARVAFVPEAPPGAPEAPPPTRIDLPPTDAAGRTRWPASAFRGRGLLVVDADWHESADRAFRERADAHFRLRQKIRVEGTVRDAEGHPLTAARVDVRAMDLRPPPAQPDPKKPLSPYERTADAPATVLTDAWGNFVVQAPIAPWLEVAVTAPAHGGASRTVPAPDGTRLDFVLKPAAARRLVVRETPVPDAAGVAPANEATSVRVLERRASVLGAQGAVLRAPLRELTRLSPGTYDASTLDDGLHEIWVLLAGRVLVPVQANWGPGAEDAVVDLARGDVYAALVLTGGTAARPVPAARGWIAPATVVPADAWSVLDAVPADGAPCDSGGAFRIEAAWRDGVATFLVAADGYGRTSSRGPVDQPGVRDPTRIQMLPAAVADVPVRVVAAESGKPIAGAAVRWGGRMAFTDAEGRAVCTGAAPRETARVESEKRHSAAVDLELVGEAKEVEARLVATGRVVARVVDITGRPLPGVPVVLAPAAGQLAGLPRETTDGKGLVAFRTGPAQRGVLVTDADAWVAEPRPAGPACAELLVTTRPPGSADVHMSTSPARNARATLVLSGPSGARREVKVVPGVTIFVADLTPGPWSATLVTASKDGERLTAELPDLRVVAGVKETLTFGAPERWSDATRVLPLVDGVVATGALGWQESGSRNDVTPAEKDGVIVFRDRGRTRVLVVDVRRRRAALTAAIEPGPGAVKVPLGASGSVLVASNAYRLRVGVAGDTSWFEIPAAAFPVTEDLREILLPPGSWRVQVNDDVHTLVLDAGGRHTLR